MTLKQDDTLVWQLIFRHGFQSCCECPISSPGTITSRITLVARRATTVCTRCVGWLAGVRHTCTVPYVLAWLQQQQLVSWVLTRNQEYLVCWRCYKRGAQVLADVWQVYITSVIGATIPFFFFHQCWSSNGFHLHLLCWRRHYGGVYLVFMSAWWPPEPPGVGVVDSLQHACCRSDDNMWYRRPDPPPFPIQYTVMET